MTETGVTRAMKDFHWLKNFGRQYFSQSRDMKGKKYYGGPSKMYNSSSVIIMTLGKSKFRLAVLRVDKLLVIVSQGASC